MMAAPPPAPPTTRPGNAADGGSYGNPAVAPAPVIPTVKRRPSPSRGNSPTASGSANFGPSSSSMVPSTRPAPQGGVGQSFGANPVGPNNGTATATNNVMTVVPSGSNNPAGGAYSPPSAPPAFVGAKTSSVPPPPPPTTRPHFGAHHNTSPPRDASPNNSTVGGAGAVAAAPPAVGGTDLAASQSFSASPNKPQRPLPGATSAPQNPASAGTASSVAAAGGGGGVPAPPVRAAAQGAQQPIPSQPTTTTNPYAVAPSPAPQSVGASAAGAPPAPTSSYAPNSITPVRTVQPLSQPSAVGNNNSATPSAQVSPPRFAGASVAAAAPVVYNGTRANNAPFDGYQQQQQFAAVNASQGHAHMSPIPTQSNLSLVASPPAHNATWNSPSRAMQQQSQLQQRSYASNPGGRTLPPPAHDVTTSSAISPAVDIVGLHRTQVQDAINSSQYAVSASQFPLSVVHEKASRTYNMTSTVAGCITVEVLVMINGAHGSGVSSKCDEVRIVNVDPARTSVRRLLNLAHKAVNFVPVTRGVFQISGRTLAARREHPDPRKGAIVTVVPRLRDLGSISEMVTLAEDDLVENLPLRDGDVLVWVEADPVIAFRPEYAVDAALYPGQDPALVGSPNRQVLSATRLPRAQALPPPPQSVTTLNPVYPDRTDVATPSAHHDMGFRNMSPNRKLRAEPGVGGPSIATRAAVGTTPQRAGVATPSWGGGASAASGINNTAAGVVQPHRDTDGAATAGLLLSRAATNAAGDAAYAAPPHSSLAAYASSSLRNSSADLYGSRNTFGNNSLTASSSSPNRVPVAAVAAAPVPAPISLSTGEVVYARSEEERRLVEEIRAIRRDMESAKYYN